MTLRGNSCKADLAGEGCHQAEAYQQLKVTLAQASSRDPIHSICCKKAAQKTSQRGKQQGKRREMTGKQWEMMGKQRGLDLDLIQMGNTMGKMTRGSNDTGTYLSD